MGSKLGYEAKMPIIDAASSGDGTIITIDSNSTLSFFKFQEDSFILESETSSGPYQILEICAIDRYSLNLVN